MSKHTLQLFRHLYNSLPPLFPEDLAGEIESSLQVFEQAENIVLQELEDEMVSHGYRVWPWRQAHREFIFKAEEQLGEHFLLPYLNENLQKKYNEFKEHGIDWHELYSGRPAVLFNSDERVELSHALVEASRKLCDYVEQEVKGLGKKDYLSRVEKYSGILEEMKTELDDLHVLADKEKDHPQLAQDIKKKIEDVEHSLCHLGKELYYHEVHNAKDFFIGRREEFARLRGVHEAKEIDFYGEDT